MAVPARIALVGYRGSGKTTLGRLLARRLDYPFVDTDLVVEQRQGVSIATIFANEGESAFRRYEAEVLSEELRQDRLVLATGGGMVVSPVNRRRLKSAAFVIWLDPPVATLTRRVAADPRTIDRRPSLTGTSAASEIESVLRQRRPWYQEVARLRIDTSRGSPETHVEEIIRGWAPEGLP